MKNLQLTSSKQVIINLIKQDFEMINLFTRLDAAGFSSIDFPSITYEVFDLLGIPEELRTNELFDRYDSWAEQLKYLPEDKRHKHGHLQTVFEEFSKLREFSYV